MSPFLTKFAIFLLVLATQFHVNSAFQNGAIHHSSRPTFAPRQIARHSRGQPLQAAFITELDSIFSYSIDEYYLATQSMTGGILCGVADAIAQVKERFLKNKVDFTRIDGDAIDFDRVFRFALKGLGGGIMWSEWYGMVDGWSLALSNDVLNMMGDQAAFGDGVHHAAQIVAAILLEQFVACPIFYSLWDIPFPMIMNGASMESVSGQVRIKIGPLLWENAKVWTFVNIIIYSLPAEFRLLAMSTADLFWQSVIASVAADTTADADDNEDDAKPSVQSSKAPERETVTRLTE